MNCKYCNREINNKGSLTSHEMCCKNNPCKKSHIHSPNAGRKRGKEYNVWNRGLTKETNILVAKIAIKTSDTMKGRKFNISPENELERRRKLSIVAKENKTGNYGGYKPGSGKGKKGWYKGIFCDSSWELAYVIYCLDHNIHITRNKEKRSYEFNGKVCNYTPDFIVGDNLVEIKGWKTPQWEAKLKSNLDIIVLYEHDLVDIFNYVKTKYGNNFIKMYEQGE